MRDFSARQTLDWILKELKRLRALYTKLSNNPGGVETDPVFLASPAGSITNTDKTLWSDKNYNNLTNKPDLTLKANLVGGKVPASELPSYVDDVLEYTNLAAFPNPGEIGKLYIADDTNKLYRWGVSSYIDITQLEADNLQTVTARGASTPSNVQFNGLVNIAPASIIASTSNLDNIIVHSPTTGTTRYIDKLIPTLQITSYVDTGTNYVVTILISGLTNIANTNNYTENTFVVKATASFTSVIATGVVPLIQHNSTLNAGGKTVTNVSYTLTFPKATNGSSLWLAGIQNFHLTVEYSNTVYNKYVVGGNQIYAFYLRRSYAGQVKVSYTGLSIVGYTANTYKQFNINAATPTVASSPTTTYPYSTGGGPIVTGYQVMFDSTANNGTSTFIGRLKENNFSGQGHVWRVKFSYTNKDTLLADTQLLYVRLRNVVSGFESIINVVLPPNQSSGQFTVDFRTIADNASLAVGEGYILDSSFTLTDTDLTVSINDITRFSLATELI